MSPKEKKTAVLSKRMKIALPVAVVFVMGLLAAGGHAYASRYADRFLPNTSIAGIDVSKKTPAEAEKMIVAAFQKYLSEGIPFTLEAKRIVLKKAPESSSEPIALDEDATVAFAFERSHGKSAAERALRALKSVVLKNENKLAILVDEAAFADALRKNLASSDEIPVQEPTYLWENERFTLVPGKKGVEILMDEAVANVEKRASMLVREPIVLTRTAMNPAVTDAEANALLPQAEAAMKSGALSLTWKDRVWEVSTPTRAGWIIARKENGRAMIGIDSKALDAFLSSFVSEIEQAPRDARFEIENDRVAAFAESKEGVEIDREKLASDLENLWLGSHAPTVAIATKVTPPEVSTADANNLGISDLLGSGTSNFSGSPTNRIKNIRNSVKKLNGILIKPDEDFSLIAALQPFTIEGGYLPEKVIKGNRIVPEIGGGACQIGTTTFRAAMKSGLPITERQNHSLVVSYYNDPINKNPGTDATIYEPAPDFKFKNDTGSHILFIAEMDEARSELRFTFWGTSDGRKGTYSAPVVHQWIPAGEPKEIKTTDLPPGKRDCQNAFRGANTSFTYTVTNPDGTKTDRVFASHYRALPQICLVGATAEEIAGTPTTNEATIPTADIPAPPPAT